MVKRKAILLTGGAGFIGSHLCEKLLETYHRVYLVDRFRNSKNKKRKEKNIASFRKDKNLTLVDTDILAKNKIETIFKTRPINTVIHLAAQADVPLSLSKPLKTVKTNLLGSAIIFETAAKYSVSHIIYASSSLVYGKEAKVPMKENDPCSSPTSPYAASMRAVELIAFSHYNQYKIPLTILRLFPVYGPRMRESLVIPSLVRKISQDRPVTIFGDGKQKRSYTYIDDVVSGIIAASIKPNGYQLINLGHPTPISLISLISLIEKILGKKVKRVFKKRRKEDLSLLYPDTEKAKRLLNWQPAISVEQGLKGYIGWKIG